MNKKNLFPILFCIIFVFVIGTITNFYSNFLTSRLSEVKKLQEKERIIQSFANQKSPEELSKRISEFTPDILDKAVITTELTQFARESNIEISSIAVDEKAIKASNSNSNMDEGVGIVGVNNTSDAINTLNSNLKSANIILQVDGGKREMYTFLQKLIQSRRYIGINTVYLSFVRDVDNAEGTISAITYYK